MLLVSMETCLTFSSSVYHYLFHILFAIMSFQNELITAKDGSHTVRDDRGSQMISDGLTCLFTLDSEVLIYKFLVYCCSLPLTVMYKAATTQTFLSVFQQMLDEVVQQVKQMAYTLFPAQFQVALLSATTYTATELFILKNLNALYVLLLT